MELTKEQIAEAALALPEQDQLEIADIICQRASGDLSEGERQDVETILMSRVDGPFIPYDDSVWDRIKANGLKKAQEIRSARLSEGHA